MNKTFLKSIQFFFEEKKNNYKKITPEERDKLSLFYSFLSGHNLDLQDEKDKNEKDLYFWQSYSKEKILEKIENKKNVIFSAPTSYGKSFIARNIAVTKCKRTLFLLQEKSLINDYAKDFVKIEKEKKLKIEIHEYIDKNNINKKCIFLLTPERLLKMIKKKLDKFDVVFIDEAPFLWNDINQWFKKDGEPKKDIATTRIKKFITVLKRIKADSFIFLSHELLKKKIENLKNSYNKLFNLSLYEHTEEFDIISRCYFYTNNENKKISWNNHFQLSQKNFNNALKKYKKYKKNFQKIPSKSLIYENKSKHYKIDFEKIPLSKKKNKQIDTIIKIYGDKHHLSECLRRRIAFHNGLIDPYVRKIIEELFKKKEIKYLYANQTLLKGVNINPDYLIMKSKATTGNKEIIRHNIVNLFGRTGRITDNKNSNQIKRYGVVFIEVKKPNNILAMIEEKPNVIEKEISKRKENVEDIFKKLSEWDLKEKSFKKILEKFKISKKIDNIYDYLETELQIPEKAKKTNSWQEIFQDIIKDLKNREKLKIEKQISNNLKKNYQKFINFESIANYEYSKKNENETKNEYEIKDNLFNDLRIIFEKIAEKISTELELKEDELILLNNYRIVCNFSDQEKKILKWLKEKKSIYEINNLLKKNI